MKLPVFAIYDSKAITFNSIYQVPNADLAIRAFTQAVNDPSNTDLYQFPHDFSLIEIAVFDNETGVIEPINHINHGMAAQYQASAQPEKKLSTRSTKAKAK